MICNSGYTFKYSAVTFFNCLNDESEGRDGL